MLRRLPMTPRMVVISVIQPDNTSLVLSSNLWFLESEVSFM